jgi:uncharacterized protein (TIGR02246 family)
MRNQVPTLSTTFLAMVATLAACQQPPQPTAELTDDQRTAIASEVTATVDEVFEAMNRHDAEAVMRHYVQSNDFSYAGVTDVKIGYEIFSRVVSPWYVANPEVSFEHEMVQTTVLSPTTAVALVRGKSSVSESLLWTQVYVKQDGRWLIAHEHESWPMCVEAPQPHPLTAQPPQ